MNNKASTVSDKILSNVKTKESVYIKIENFISSYFRVSLSLFDNSWIYNEYIIRQNYIETSNNLREDILSSIHKVFTDEIIIYKKINKKYYTSTIIQLKNRNLFVYYSEDKEQKIRFVEDIEFNRR